MLARCWLAFLLLAQVALAEPNKAKWEADMLSFGASNCANLTTYDQTYYDGGRVYYQLYDYTKDAKWLACAKKSVEIYRDQYIFPNNGAVSGWWNFSDGLLREGSPASIAALKLLVNAAFMNMVSGWGASVVNDASYSREMAYALTTWDNIKKAGLPEYDAAKREAIASGVRAHVGRWFVVKDQTPQPFMVGLTAEAIIRADGEAALSNIKLIGDGLKPYWDEVYQSFMYQNGAAPATPGGDLNQLISPLYAWLCARDSSYCAFAEKVFNGGVSSAYLGAGKQFNQNYRWSFDFIRWFPAAVPTPTPVATVAACEKWPPANTQACTNYLLRQIRDKLK